ncbi:MAG TPA: cytochrome c biogenesis protein CcdA [Candidatus Paceibacterota bacterium]|nr:cytochrome c biogenesis protein CcdA [Candidatus Paceibacterota bacterium]
MQQSSGLRTGLIVASVVLLATFVLGLLWFLFLAPAVGGDSELGKLGWFFFSFAAGLTMIVMPCTLPLAFVIVPLAMGKGLGKGLGMALSFGAGVALMLSTYGALAALAGKAGLDLLGAQVEDIKNWVYFFAGIFAYVFALAEIGLVKFHMPSYTGSAPAFIQAQKDYLKAFLLGLFLGNIGVGCPHPATPLILIEIASSADVFYGWTMFLVHAIGRVVPLLLLAILAVLGVNGLNWLVARKDRIERANGWAMVFVAGFILTLGLFTHDWWVNSGQHNLLERVTQEHYFNQTINTQLGTAVEHVHGLETGYGIFGQPLEWGNWFVVFLWILPLWWYYSRERRRVIGTPALRVQKLEAQIAKLESERRNMEVSLHLPDGEQGARLKELESKQDAIEKERKVYEESVRYGVESGLREPKDQAYEEDALRLRRNWYISLSLFLISTFAIFLPIWFASMAGAAHTDTHADPEHMTASAETPTVKDALKILNAPAAAPAAAMPGDGHDHAH